MHCRTRFKNAGKCNLQYNIDVLEKKYSACGYDMNTDKQCFVPPPPPLNCGILFRTLLSESKIGSFPLQLPSAPGVVNTW